MRGREALVQMRVGAIEEGIAGADHGDVLTGVELGGERRGARIVERDERVAIVAGSVSAARW